LSAKSNPIQRTKPAWKGLSGIFYFAADKITLTLRIDDRVLKTIIHSLYYPKSPYEFSVLSVEILGNVYEQFLGKAIRQRWK